MLVDLMPYISDMLHYLYAKEINISVQIFQEHCGRD